MKQIRLNVSLVLILIFFCASPASAETKSDSIYINEQYGFSIAPPEFPSIGEGDRIIPVKMFGTRVNGSSSNVNVMVYRAKADRKNYLAKRRSDLTSRGMTVNSIKNKTVSGRKAAVMDLEGAYKGKVFHWLSLFVFDEDKVYEVTCTALDMNYPLHLDSFQHCIESFKLNE